MQYAEIIKQATICRTAESEMQQLDALILSCEGVKAIWAGRRDAAAAELVALVVPLPVAAPSAVASPAAAVPPADPELVARLTAGVVEASAAAAARPTMLMPEVFEHLWPTPPAPFAMPQPTPPVTPVLDNVAALQPQDDDAEMLAPPIYQRGAALRAVQAMLADPYWQGATFSRVLLLNTCSAAGLDRDSAKPRITDWCRRGILERASPGLYRAGPNLQGQATPEPPEAATTDPEEH